MDRKVIELRRKLDSFKLPDFVKSRWDLLVKEGFCLQIISPRGNFCSYIDYVLKNKTSLVPEREYVKNCLSKEESWGEILVIKKKDDIVASFGPNRVEKDKNGKARARPGYFSVLSEYRNIGLGTVLWWFGLERMKKMGAEYVQCSVEKKNSFALKIYLNSGMKVVKETSEMGKKMQQLIKKFILRKIGKVSLLIPLDKTPINLIYLNNSALYIWEKLSDGYSVAQCAKKMSRKFNVQGDVIKTNILKLLSVIEKNSLVKKTDKKSIISSFKLGKIPVHGSFELTGQCNLDCFHCYARGERKQKDLSLKEIKRIIDQLVESGCLFIQLTGGECLMRKDFKEIYLYIRKAGIIPTISTNATLFSNDLVKVFKKYPPYQIIVSLYGATENTHDKITQIKGSFKKTATNVKRLKKIGSSVWLSAVVMKENLFEVKQMKRLAKQINVPIVFYPFLIPTLDKNKDPITHCISDKQCTQIVNLNRKIAPFKTAEEIKRKKQEIFYPCNAGMQSFHINSRGNLFLCKIERGVGFSLLKNSFENCWKNLGRIRNSKLKLPKMCLDCNQIINCTMCPPMMRLYDSSGSGKVYCRMVKAKKNNQLK